MARKPRVAIIGAGIGGLSTGRTLLQRGWEADIYDQVNELTEVGAGIQMTPNAVKVLRALDLEESVAACSFLPEAIVGLDGLTDQITFRTPLRDVCPELYGANYMQLHRADLQRILRDGLPDQRVHLSKRCVHVANQGDTATARFEDGTEIEADLIVGADGIRSPIRNTLFQQAEPRYTGNTLYRMLIPIDPPDFQLVYPSSSMWLGPGCHVVTYYVQSGNVVNVAACVERAEWSEESWTLRSSREELLSVFEDWAPRLRRLLAKADTIYKYGLFDRDPMPTWTVGRITLLGDAAHPMLPFLSQGAAMGLEDGYVLGRCLHENEDNIPAALTAYETARIPRTTRVQLASRERGRSHHLTSPLARLRRDLLQKFQNFWNPNKGGLRASWVYEYDPTG